MKKLLILLSLILVASISMATNVTKTGSIKLGTTEVTGGFKFTAADTIDADDTITLYIVNKQRWFQHQTFTIALEQVTVTPAVTITAYGRVTSTSEWVQIGTPISWTTSANNGSITSTSPQPYNYLKVECVASSASQKSKITAFEVKTSNMYDIPASSGTLTISRATEGTVTIQTADNNANAAAVYRAGGTGALTIGAATGTTAITSSDWSIDATGVMAGIGNITTNGTINGLTILNSKARLVTTATAATDSTTASSMLSAVDQFVTITSGGATRVITLPAASATTVGLVIEGVVGANGFELRVATAQAASVKLNDVTTSVEAAIPATSTFRVVCISATEWILTAVDEKGAVITAIVPDAI